MGAIHWTDWITGPIILLGAILPMAAVKTELSPPNQAYGYLQKKSPGGTVLWLSLGLIGTLHCLVVLLALGTVTGMAGVMAFSALFVLVSGIGGLLYEWRSIRRPMQLWSSLRIFVLCIAADLVILPYLAARHAWLGEAAAGAS